jgi:hypothetical protein
MYVSFDQLPPTARVWIYQAGRQLASQDIIAVLPRLAQFAEEWTSHGRSLLASAEFLHQQFLVVGLDEGVAGASGCSIDASVRFVQGLEQLLQVDFLDKSRLAFMQGGEVRLVDHRKLRDALAAGEVTADTLFFDNTIGVKAQLEANWPAPAGETWLGKYFARAEKTIPPA